MALKTRARNIRPATPIEVRSFARSRALTPGRTVGSMPVARERFVRGFNIRTYHGTELGFARNFTEARRILEMDPGISFTRTRRLR